MRVLVCPCVYLLIGGGVSSVCLSLVPQDSLSVQVQSFQLLDQIALLRCVLCALSVQSLHLCKLTTTQTHNMLYTFILYLCCDC